MDDDGGFLWDAWQSLGAVKQLSLELGIVVTFVVGMWMLSEWLEWLERNRRAK